MSNGNGTGATTESANAGASSATLDPSKSILASIEDIKSEIKTIDARRAALVATLKTVRDGLKGSFGRGGPRKASTPRKPKAAAAAK